MEILIENVRLFHQPEGSPKTDIRIRDGKMAEIGPKLDGSGCLRLDGTGLVAAPGFVDMHVHFRDPGFTQKEDIDTGLDAAFAGGFTGAAVMPNTNPVTDNVDTVRYIMKKANKRGANIYPVCAITKGLAGEELTDFAALRAAGAVAVSDDGKPVMDSRRMRDAMLLAKKEGLLPVSHCEDANIAGKGIMNEGSVSRKLGVEGLDRTAEDVMIAREIALSADLDVPVHIAHVSTAGGVRLIRDAKARGVPVTAETCPHYFSLEESLLMNRDADYRMNPPLRTREDVEEVCRGVCDGTLDVIVTDHAPHCISEKADFEKAPNGIVGLETSFAVSNTYLVKTGKLTMAQLIERMSVTPCKLLGIKGRGLLPGNIADLVLFDPDEEWTADPSQFRSKARNSAFKGMRLSGRVKYTICNGVLQYEEKR